MENSISIGMERIQRLIDQDSFVEINSSYRLPNSVFGYQDVSIEGEGVVTGFGTIGGKKVCIAAQSVDRLGASFSIGQARKILEIMENAEKSGVPMIFLWDSEGARAQEGPNAVHAYSMVMKKMAELSGVIPILSVVLGKLMGSAAFMTSLSDFTLMTKKGSELGLKSDKVVRVAFSLPDDVDVNDADNNAEEGTCHIVCEDEEDAFAQLKRLLKCIPSNNLEDTYIFENDDSIYRKTTGGDLFELVKNSADGEVFFELQKGYGWNLHIGFVSYGGLVAGVIMNEPGKPISKHDAKKAARFIYFLDAYHIPIISFVDNDGSDLSHNQSSLKAMSKMIYAYGEATAPMISIIAGRAIGDGYTAMSNKANGADIVYAFKDARIGAMDEDLGSLILFDGRNDKQEEYAKAFLSTETAAQQGLIDKVIDPSDLRFEIIKALDIVINKRVDTHSKKHGILPL
ncbi:MAG: hypothetical protein IKI62_03655 [Clostridia bacterium]|nr:hypothetical protein [Clostridia bacterium]